jgi:ribonucleotide reductase beta subunit family protein with ferritin-like domain
MLKADFFESDRFTKFADEKFVLFEADFTRNVDLVSSSQKADNLILKNKYKISSYPIIIILDKKEKIIGVKKSYNLMRDPSCHFNFIESVIKKLT